MPRLVDDVLMVMLQYMDVDTIMNGYDAGLFDLMHLQYVNSVNVNNDNVVSSRRLLQLCNPKSVNINVDFHHSKTEEEFVGNLSRLRYLSTTSFLDPNSIYDHIFSTTGIACISDCINLERIIAKDMCNIENEGEEVPMQLLNCKDLIITDTDRRNTVDELEYASGEDIPPLLINAPNIENYEGPNVDFMSPTPHLKTLFVDARVTEHHFRAMTKTEIEESTIESLGMRDCTSPVTKADNDIGYILRLPNLRHLDLLELGTQPPQEIMNALCSNRLQLESLTLRIHDNCTIRLQKCKRLTVHATYRYLQLADFEVEGIDRPLIVTIDCPKAEITGGEFIRFQDF